MKVKFHYDDTTLHEYECSDVKGLYEAIKESRVIHFNLDTYQYDSSALNHYSDESGTMQQELIVYLKVPVIRKVKVGRK